MPQLGESVDNYPDSVFSIDSREARDKVHSYMLPWLAGDGEGSEDSKGCVTAGFRSSARLTVLDKPFDVLPHGGPVVQPIDELDRFGTSLVSSGWCFMMVLDDSKYQW